MPISVRIEDKFIAPVSLHHCYEPVLLTFPFVVIPSVEVEMAVRIVQSAITGSIGFTHKKAGGRFNAHQAHFELKDHPECCVVDWNKARIPPPGVSE